MYTLFFTFISFLLFASLEEDALSKMSLDEKIGQLFMAPACPPRKDSHFADWESLIQNLHIGNIILKQSDPISQVDFLNRLQELAKIPLLVAADAEWGLGMRMTDTISYPRNMTLGAIADTSLLFTLGQEIGRQARLVGIHMNLAPVCDVNNNPKNPVIHMRSFGDDPEKVAHRASEVAKGLRSRGILTAVKHFPGHGDTSTDSHLDLPLIPHSSEHLDKIELVPFRRAIMEGTNAIMTAHILVPALDPQYPMTLSLQLKKMLRDELLFQGLIIADALNMKALADRFSPEEIAVLARKAGNDVLLYGAHKYEDVDQLIKDTIPRAYMALKQAYISQELSMDELNQSVLRILRAKKDIGKTATLAGLNTRKGIALKRELYKQAVTLIGNAPHIEGQKVKVLSFGENDLVAKEFDSMENYDQLIIAVHQKEALTPENMAIMKQYADKAILCLFTTPYVLKDLPHFPTILLAYENDPFAQEAVIEILKGYAIPNGHLPVASY